jgi:hypothetical protein
MHTLSRYIGILRDIQVLHYYFRKLSGHSLYITVMDVCINWKYESTISKVTEFLIPHHMEFEACFSRIPSNIHHTEKCLKLPAFRVIAILYVFYFTMLSDHIASMVG